MRDDDANAKSSDSQKGKENKDDDNWNIPSPPTNPSKQNVRVTTSSSTPLLPIRQRNANRRTKQSFSKRRDNASSTRASLFGEATFESPARSQASSQIETEVDDDFRPKGLAGFFFGFMYEEPYDDSFDHDEEDESKALSVWNPTNIALFSAYTLTTAATAVPILLIPTIGKEFLSDGSEASAFTSRATSSAVLGTACGKLLNGPMGDVLGARRTSVLYSILLSLSLLCLALSQDSHSAAYACFYVEFFQSVQWPCIIVILATHFGPNSHHKYEGGIYVTSIASRLGSLLGLPVFSILLRRSHWRVVCLVGAWIAMIGSSVAYLFFSDSPLRVNDPQNALHPGLQYQISTTNFRKRPRHGLRIAARVIHSILIDNLWPSLKHVLKSGTFWIVAVAHTGSSLVRTSDRILGTYLLDTSMGYLSESRAGGLSVCLSFSTILGLIIAGNMFSQRKERQRKWLVSRLYKITIAACYSLAMLAIPSLRYLIDTPALVLFFQIVAASAMGFGIAVMFSIIPGLVGSSFGNHKGLFSAYTDGVAYGLASMVWKIVASTVADKEDGGGWAYGWAAVALIIVLCAILMVEFMEHYFVRASGRHHGTHETILFA